VTINEPPKPKPKPKPLVQPEIKIVEDDEILPEQDIILDFQDIEDLPDDFFNNDDKEEEEADHIFINAEQQPAPVGGLEAFYKFIQKEMRYPAQARRMGIEGRVYVEFVVDKDGSLTMIKLLKGIGAGCDEEAVRVLKEAPKWMPGKQRGRPVRVKMTVPIFFKLQ
jgi:periplasmic protein TonB